MRVGIKVAFYLAGLCSVILMCLFGIPGRNNLGYSFTDLPTYDQLFHFYQIDNKDDDLFKVASTFSSYVGQSSISLIDFIIIATIEIMKVIFLDKPLYLEVQEDNQVYDEEKIPSYIVGRKKRHLLDEKQIPIIRLILTIILIVKDIMILPLSLIVYDWQTLGGLVQYGAVISHTLLSPQVLLSLQHLAYSRFATIQDIAEDTDKEQQIESLVVFCMHCIRIFLSACLLSTLPIVIIGSIFGIILTLIFCITTLGLFIPGLVISYIWKRRGFSNRSFIPLNLIVFIGVGMIVSVSYILQSGNFIADGCSIKSIFQFYFGPNTFNLWYFAHSTSPLTWQKKLDYIIRIIAVI